MILLRSSMCHCSSMTGWMLLLPWVPKESTSVKKISVCHSLKFSPCWLYSSLTTRDFWESIPSPTMFLVYLYSNIDKLLELN